jgi:hypothetical protein
MREKIFRVVVTFGVLVVMSVAMVAVRHRPDAD